MSTVLIVAKHAIQIAAACYLLLVVHAWTLLDRYDFISGVLVSPILAGVGTGVFTYYWGPSDWIMGRSLPFPKQLALLYVSIPVALSAFAYVAAMYAGTYEGLYWVIVSVVAMIGSETGAYLRMRE